MHVPLFVFMCLCVSVVCLVIGVVHISSSVFRQRATMHAGRVAKAALLTDAHSDSAGSCGRGVKKSLVWRQ